jgi:hypothetical protein
MRLGVGLPADPFITTALTSGVFAVAASVRTHGRTNGSVALKKDEPPSGFKLERGKNAEAKSDCRNMIVSTVMRVSPRCCNGMRLCDPKDPQHVTTMPNWQAQRTVRSFELL